jgi:DNA helicase II / ATP-dependent DNA helicase PcrA
MVVLNEAQVAAVQAKDGPTLVLAGAGSGKTRVIIERLAWLVEERGVDPRNFLALTFTNKAAAEMRERFVERIGADRVAAWLGTFHSFGLFILRREMDKLGRSKTFTIFDDADQLSLMKRLVRNLPEGAEAVSPREALSWVSLLKQSCSTPNDEYDTPFDETCRGLWHAYHNTLAKVSAVDFDDLLVLLVRLFQEHPDVLDKYQRRYRYVLLDEYQDTNRAQYLIARELSKAHGNLFAVGDEDQSIYSWRGADINNILDFGNDFPAAEVHRLEQNFRSTKPILTAANRVVKNNINRLGKTLWTQEEGGRVRFHSADNAELEADFVVRDMAQRELPPKTMVVLYRTNAQARVMEEAFRKKGIHYIIIGGTKFYGRKEIKDVLAYLRILVNPDDDESLRRIINVPARGIGGKTLEMIEAYAKQRSTSLLQTLRDMETDEQFSPRARQSATALAEMVDRLAMRCKTEGVAPIVETLLEDTKYSEYLERSDEKDFRSRMEMVEEFLVSCRQYDGKEAKGLLDFLQDLALLSDVDQYDQKEPAVTLMTCHNAKGLEFDHVYLVGLEEGLLPLFRDFDDEDADVEEERRLCYVAMTRARRSLTLTAAQSRMLYGRSQDGRELSRFVHEIGLEDLERVGVARAKKKAAPTPCAPVNTGGMKTGARVRHARFGLGYIMFTQGSGDRMKVRIRFNSGRTAMLMVKQAPLEIVEEKSR